MKKIKLLIYPFFNRNTVCISDRIFTKEIEFNNIVIAIFLSMKCCKKKKTKMSILTTMRFVRYKFENNINDLAIKILMEIDII